MHWNGTAWSSALSPIVGTELHAVWGSGPDDVWSVGSDTRHFDPARVAIVTITGIRS